MVDYYIKIKKIKEYAQKNNVPIILDESLDYLTTYIIKHNISNILEIGTAIGYSSIMMALVNPNIMITSIERDEKRYLEALKNIKDLGLEKRISLIFNDALNIKVDEEYDLLFIDAAKSQNIKLFEKFSRNLKAGGTIITDNMNFHDLVNQDENTISSHNLRSLVKKIKEYRLYLQNNTKYKTEILDIGDGLAISVKCG